MATRGDRRLGHKGRPVAVRGEWVREDPKKKRLRAQDRVFTLCMTLRQDTPEHREKVAAYLKPVREILEPDRIEFFAGKMEYRKWRSPRA